MLSIKQKVNPLKLVVENCVFIVDGNEQSAHLTGYRSGPTIKPGQAMKKVATILLGISLSLTACFKKTHVNENALLHQRACIESLEVKDHDRARTHCELCLEYDATMPECLNGIGLVALLEKDEEKAIRFFTRALRQNNDFSQARNNLGVIYFSHGDFTSALKYFDRALEVDPSNSDARYNAGLSNFRLGQRFRASNDVKRSIDHLFLAKAQIKKLLAIEPTYDTAFRDLGLINLNLYDLYEFDGERQTMLSEAKSAFLQCKEANPNEDGCFEGLAQVYFEEGNFDQATANHFLCLTHAPNNSACRNGIVRAYEKTAQAAGGYRRFMELVKGEPSNAFAHEAFCAALFERNLNDEAIRECEQALRMKPDLCSAQFRLGEYFASVLHGERATRHCQAYVSCTKTEEHEIKICQDILATVRR